MICVQVLSFFVHVMPLYSVDVFILILYDMFNTVPKNIKNVLENLSHFVLFFTWCY